MNKRGTIFLYMRGCSEFIECGERFLHAGMQKNVQRIL